MTREAITDDKLSLTAASNLSMNKELAKQTLDNFYKDYVLTIETIDGNQITIDGKDISMHLTQSTWSFCF